MLSFTLKSLRNMNKTTLTILKHNINLIEEILLSLYIISLKITMIKAIGFIFILIGLLLLIKYLGSQRDYFSVDHNLFQQEFTPKPMGTTRCEGKRTSRGQICTSTFVPKTDEYRSMEVNYK